MSKGHQLYSFAHLKSSNKHELRHKLHKETMVK